MFVGVECGKTKIGYTTLEGRIQRGWTAEDALTVEADTKARMLVTIDGETLPLSAWAKKAGLPRGTLKNRIVRRGWDPKEAISLPAGARGLGGYKPFVALTLNGETKTLQEWCVQFNVHRNTVDARLKRGWTIEAALTTKPHE